MEAPHAPPLLRTRRGLLFSTLPAISVLAVLGLLLALGHHRSAIDDRHAETRTIAVASAFNARRFVDDQLATLSAVAGAPDVRRLRYRAVAPYLRTVAESAHFTGGLGLLDARGVLRVSSSGHVPRRGISLADRRYVRVALEQGRAAASNALMGRNGGGPVVAFSYPVVSPAGSRNGALAASLRLDEIGQTLDRLLYAQNAGEIVLDGRGNLIVGPHAVTSVHPPRRRALPLALMRSRRVGVLGALPSPDGKRLIGYAAVPGTSWMVVIDEDHGDVIGPLDRALWAEIVALALFFTLGVLAVLTGARRLDRLDELREAALAEQRDIAVRLQRSLLPDLPTAAPLEVHASYAPAQGAMAVGGDWYDVVELGDGRVALSVGDVAGHGLPAAAAMGQLRSAVRTLALGRAEPAAALAQLDHFAATLHGRPLATVVFAVLDSRTGRLRYAVAGHPPPFVVRADGTTELLTDGRSPLLGVQSADARPEGEARLGTGDTLVFYTDGLVEHPDSSIDAGIAALTRRAAAAAADGPAQLAAGLVDGVGEPRRDDTAVLCARLAPNGDGGQPSSVAS